MLNQRLPCGVFAFQVVGLLSSSGGLLGAPEQDAFKDLHVVRVDHDRYRLLVVMGDRWPATVPAAKNHLHRLEAAVDDVLPDRGRDWRVSFFDAAKLADYTTETAEPR